MRPTSLSDLNALLEELRRAADESVWLQRCCECGKLGGTTGGCESCFEKAYGRLAA